MACALLLAATGLHAGCGGDASGLTTSSLSAEAPAGVTNEHPMARPIAVAWTSARAKRCGFYFDPAKLRASYLSYETTQGAAGEQLAKIANSYDSTFKLISERVGAEPDYCDKRGPEIKAELQRHLAGDFTPNLPKPKPVVACGFFGCPTSAPDSDKEFSSKDFWKKQEDKAVRR